MKKDEARYTIRFCPADPRHRIVMDALDAAGRRKASLIVNAVWEYLAQYGEEATLKSATDYLERIISAKASQSRESNLIPEEAVMSMATKSDNASNKSLFDEDMLDVVLGGLSMFVNNE